MNLTDSVGAGLTDSVGAGSCTAEGVEIARVPQDRYTNPPTSRRIVTPTPENNHRLFVQIQFIGVSDRIIPRLCVDFGLA